MYMRSRQRIILAIPSRGRSSTPLTEARMQPRLPVVRSNQVRLDSSLFHLEVTTTVVPIGANRTNGANAHRPRRAKPNRSRLHLSTRADTAEAAGGSTPQRRIEALWPKSLTPKQVCLIHGGRVRSLCEGPTNRRLDERASVCAVPQQVCVQCPRLLKSASRRGNRWCGRIPPRMRRRRGKAQEEALVPVEGRILSDPSLQPDLRLTIAQRAATTNRNTTREPPARLYRSPPPPPQRRSKRPLRFQRPSATQTVIPNATRPGAGSAPARRQPSPGRSGVKTKRKVKRAVSKRGRGEHD